MARAGLCFSLRDVARRAGVSPESVRRVEQGDPSVQLDTLCAVAEAVGIDVVVTGYPAAGMSLRDAGQLTVARIVCAMAHPSWQQQLEVPPGIMAKPSTWCCSARTRSSPRRSIGGCSTSRRRIGATFGSATTSRRGTSDRSDRSSSRRTPAATDRRSDRTWS
jgi:DNA-binding XRE family transcriptional regulator